MNRSAAFVLVLMLVAVCAFSWEESAGSSHPAYGSREVLFSDSFTGAAVDTARWAVYGDGVNSPGESLRVYTKKIWDDGVSARRTFSRPPADSCLVIEGSFLSETSNFNMRGYVVFQSSWGAMEDDGCALEFHYDNCYFGDSNVRFKLRQGGSEVENQVVAAFDPARALGWRLVFFDTGCEVYLDLGEGWEWTHTSALGNFDIGIALTGDDISYVEGTLYWDDVLVERGSRVQETHFDALPLAGLYPTTVEFTDRTSGGVTFWDWDFGDGTPHSSEQDPTHAYADTGRYDVTLITSSANGTDSETRSDLIWVGESWDDDFTGAGIDPAKWTKHGVHATSDGDSLEILSNRWTYQGVESVARFERPGPDEMLVVEGRYLISERSDDCLSAVRLQNAWGLSDGDCYWLEFDYCPVDPEGSVVTFFVDSGGERVEERIVGTFAADTWVPWRFELLESGCDFYLLSEEEWVWECGTDSVDAPCRIVMNGKGKGYGFNNYSKWDDISVTRETAVTAAHFLADLTHGSAPLEVSFSDRSRGGVTSWEWDFGDSSSHSYEQHPVHTYATPGDYTVTLSVSGPGGADTCTRVGYVCAVVPLDFTVNPSSGPAPLGVQFEGSSPDSIESWEWDFGDGAAHEYTRNPVHLYDYPGEYDVTLWSSGPTGSGECMLKDAVFAYVPWQMLIDLPLGHKRSQAAAWCDYDGDGDDDVYVVNWEGANLLLRNDGGTFTDVTVSPLDDAGVGRAAVWGDYDNDGDADIFLANAGTACRLFRNDGGGLFTDATSSPLSDVVDAKGASWVDYDLDGDIDLYVISMNAPNRLLRNDGGSVFTDVSSGPIAVPSMSRGFDWADYDNDGDPDVFVARYHEPDVLLRNNGGTFEDVTPEAMAYSGDSRGVVSGDFDNDGDMDVYVATCSEGNRLYRNDGATFSDVSFYPVNYSHYCLGASWGDFDNDADLDLSVPCWGMYGLICRNDGDDWFRNVARDPIDDIQYTICSTWVDADSDGDLDLYNTEEYYHNKLFVNEFEWPHHWLEVELEGSASNKMGIGARVRVVAGGVSQIRDVGAGCAYGGQNPIAAHFGLAEEATADSLIVGWPGGAVTVLTGVQADRRVTVQEDSNAPPRAPRGLSACCGAEAGSIEVSWFTNRETDFDHFRLERDSTSLFAPAPFSCTESEACHTDVGLAPGVTCYYRVFAVDSDGHESAPSDTLEMCPLPTGVGEVPGEGSLAQGPNPFSGSTALAFRIPEDGTPLAVKVYDVSGRLVRSLADGPEPAGVRRIVWDGTDASGRRVATGVYFVRSEVRGAVETRKLVFLK